MAEYELVGDRLMGAPLSIGGKAVWLSPHLGGARKFYVVRGTSVGLLGHTFELEDLACDGTQIFAFGQFEQALRCLFVVERREGAEAQARAAREAEERERAERAVVEAAEREC